MHPFQHSGAPDPDDHQKHEPAISPEHLSNVLLRLNLIDEKKEVAPLPLQSLQNDLLHHQWQVRLAAVYALQRQGEALPLTLLKDQDKTIRAVTVQSLDASQPSRAALLLEALHDSAWEVRAAAVSTLGKHAEAIYMDEISAAASEEDASVRAVAVQVLGSLGKRVPLHVLYDALQDDVWQVRMAAVFALADTTHQIEAILQPFLHDQDLFVQRAAQNALAHHTHGSVQHETQPESPVIHHAARAPQERHSRRQNYRMNLKRMVQTMLKPSQTLAPIPTKHKRRYIGLTATFGALAILLSAFFGAPALLQHYSTKITLGAWTISDASLSIGQMHAYRTFTVNGHAMEPTIANGTIVNVDTTIYQTQRPQRGDIIMLQREMPNTVYMLKRIIAIPGDTITIDNTKVILNGKLLSEPYVLPANQGNPFLDHPIHGLKIPPGEFFVLGDKRYLSDDSRDWGLVASKDIIGKVLMPAQ